MHRLLETPPAADQKRVVVVVSRVVINGREYRDMASFSDRNEGKNYYMALKRQVKKIPVIQSWIDNGTYRKTVNKNKKGAPYFERIIFRGKETGGFQRYEIEIKEIFLRRTH